MFAFLRGIVTRIAADHIELDVGGLGYEVHAPESVHRKLAVNEEATLLTYCHIREDAFQIYGFLREEEKALFKMLLGVSGIGPKASLAVLSAMSPADFKRAVLDNDVNAFSKVSGIGKKTGQRLILEANAKLGQVAELDAILGGPEDRTTPESDDVIAALCSLGCTLAEARKAAAGARKQLGTEAADEDLVAQALRSMSKV